MLVELHMYQLFSVACHTAFYTLKHQFNQFYIPTFFYARFCSLVFETNIANYSIGVICSSIKTKHYQWQLRRVLHKFFKLSRRSTPGRNFSKPIYSLMGLICLLKTFKRYLWRSPSWATSTVCVRVKKKFSVEGFWSWLKDPW